MAKATAVCTCKVCGRNFERTATKRNRREADSWEAWAVSYYDMCPECMDAQTQLHAEESTKRSVALGLPALTGSYRQVAWAEDIRTKAREEVGEWMQRAAAALATDPQQTFDAQFAAAKEATEKMFQRETRAGWWIDHRYLDGLGWIRQAQGLTTD